MLETEIERVAVKDTDKNREILNFLGIGFEEDARKNGSGTDTDVLIFSVEEREQFLKKLNLDLGKKRITENIDGSGTSVFLEIGDRNVPGDPVVLKDKFVKICSEKWLEDKKFGAADQITRLRRDVTIYQERLTTALRELAIEREKLNLSRRTNEEAKSKSFEKNFREILGMPGVKGLVVGREKITIITDNIRIKGKENNDIGSVYDIGEFEIELYFNGTVKFCNLTRLIDGYDHPHIEYHNPCLGNIEEALPQLIAEMEFSSAAMLCIKYLLSYNWGASYVDIDIWPVVEQH
jgi:hypothetical protein